MSKESSWNINDKELKKNLWFFWKFFEKIKNFFWWWDKEFNIYYSWIQDFNWKFAPNCKIIWDKMITLHHKNYNFYMNNINPDSEKFVNIFEEEYWNLKINDVFKEEIEIYDNEFTDFAEEQDVKWIQLNFWNWTLKNREERWNILTYDYFKNWKLSWKLVFYMFNNQKIYPIDIITIKKNKEQIRKYEDIEVDYWIYSKNPEILNNISWWWTFLFPYYNFDLNLYNVKIFLKELYYFLYYMTFSLFFKKNDKLTQYYKSRVIDIHMLNTNLKDDTDIRTDIKNVIKNREWYNIWTALKKIIPWNYDITYYYCFYSIKQKLYPCYISVVDWNFKWWKVNINLSVNIWNEWLSHYTILDIFRRIPALEPKSFIYENMNDFNIQKDVWFISYSQIETLKSIVKSYKMLFKWTNN